MAEHRTAMLRANGCATAKAVLGAHTLNRAAEPAGTGVTVNAYRPGSVDIALPSAHRILRRSAAS